MVFSQNAKVLQKASGRLMEYNIDVQKVSVVFSGMLKFFRRSFDGVPNFYKKQVVF